jgi:hypothetical protein
MDEFVGGVATMEDSYAPFCIGSAAGELIQTIQRASMDDLLADPDYISATTLWAKAPHRKYQNIGRGGSGVA